MPGLLARNQEQSEADASQNRESEAAVRIDVFIRPRDQPNAHQSQYKPEQLQAVGHSFGANGEQHR